MNKTLKKNRQNITKSHKEKKQMFTPLEYVRLNNPQMFASNMFSKGKVISMNQDNLEKYREKLKGKNSHHQLISQLINSDIIDLKKNRVIVDALLQVDRKYYCKEKSDICYNDTSMKILDEQTISAPHMHTYACSFLQDKLIPGSSVLDVGSGSGLLTVIFANLVNARGDKGEKRGKVVGVDISDDIVEFSRENVKMDTINRDLLNENNNDHFKLISGNGKEGYPFKSKDKLYDVIHVGALNQKNYAPPYLKYQLKEGGLMFIPSINENNSQIIKIYQRKNGKIEYISTDLQVRFVPLVDSKEELFSKASSR